MKRLKSLGLTALVLASFGTSAFGTQTYVCKTMTDYPWTITFNLGAEASVSWLVAHGDGPADHINVGSVPESVWPSIFSANAQLVHSWTSGSCMKFRFFDLNLIDKVLEMRLTSTSEGLIGTAKFYDNQPKPIKCF